MSLVVLAVLQLRPPGDLCVLYCSLAELRQRQEMIMRNQMAMAPQILAQGQQRLQGVPAQFEPRFMERFVPELTLKLKR